MSVNLKKPVNSVQLFLVSACRGANGVIAQGCRFSGVENSRVESANLD